MGVARTSYMKQNGWYYGQIHWYCNYTAPHVAQISLHPCLQPQTQVYPGHAHSVRSEYLSEFVQKTLAVLSSNRDINLNEEWVSPKGI